MPTIQEKLQSFNAAQAKFSGDWVERTSTVLQIQKAVNIAMFGPSIKSVSAGSLTRARLADAIATTQGEVTSRNLRKLHQEGALDRRKIKAFNEVKALSTGSRRATTEENPDPYKTRFATTQAAPGKIARDVGRTFSQTQTNLRSGIPSFLNFVVGDATPLVDMMMKGEEITAEDLDRQVAAVSVSTLREGVRSTFGKAKPREGAGKAKGKKKTASEKFLQELSLQQLTEAVTGFTPGRAEEGTLAVPSRVGLTKVKDDNFAKGYRTAKYLDTVSPFEELGVKGLVLHGEKFLISTRSRKSISTLLLESPDFHIIARKGIDREKERIRRGVINVSAIRPGATSALNSKVIFAREFSKLTPAQRKKEGFEVSTIHVIGEVEGLEKFRNLQEPVNLGLKGKPSLINFEFSPTGFAETVTAPKTPTAEVAKRVSTVDPIKSVSARKKKTRTPKKREPDGPIRVGPRGGKFRMIDGKKVPVRKGN